LLGATTTLFNPTVCATGYYFVKATPSCVPCSTGILLCANTNANTPDNLPNNCATGYYYQASSTSC